MRVILDLFLEHPEFGHLLTGCQCPQGDFRTGHPVSLSFTMNAIDKNRPGVTVNLLLTVNTGNEGNGNPFITPTIATNHLNSQDNRNTVAFKSHIPEAKKQINACLADIANQGPTETTATNCHDCPDPNRCQFNKLNDPQQYQSTYTSQHHRSYNNLYNHNYNRTWESHTDRTCKSCGTKGHIAKHCTKQTF